MLKYFRFKCRTFTYIFSCCVFNSCHTVCWRLRFYFVLFSFLVVMFLWLCHPGTGCSRTGLGIAVARWSERLQTRRHLLTTWPPTEQSAQLLMACLNGPVADQHSGTNMTYWQVVWTLHRFTLKNSDSSCGDTGVTRNIDERVYLSSFKPIVKY